MTNAELKQRALDLPIEERRDLVETLWESLEPFPEGLPLSDWERDLLDERMAEAERNPDVWVPWEDVKADALKLLETKRKL